MFTVILAFVTFFLLIVLLAACFDPFVDGSSILLVGLTALVFAILMVVSAKHDAEDEGFQSRSTLDNMIEVCEANLPRTQHCTLVAVPAKR